MLTFGKRDPDGFYYSTCGRYVIWQKAFGSNPERRWCATKMPMGAGADLRYIAEDVDFEEVRWACDDDLHRYPCGCVLRVRPDWWVHCPKCGSLLPKPKPYVPPEPKVKRKKKEPNRPEWLKKATGGYEGGHEWDCIHDGRNWALVRVPGRTGWVSLGQQAYHPTSYRVMRTSENRGMMHVSLAETKGLTSLLDVPRFKKNPKEFSALDVHEGRATKEDLARLTAMVHELDKVDV